MRSAWTLGTAAIVGISWVTLIYLVLPLLVIISVSFSDTAYIEFPPRGFTMRWYSQFLHDPSYIEAFQVSIELAVLSTAIIRASRRLRNLSVRQSRASSTALRVRLPL